MGEHLHKKGLRKCYICKEIFELNKNNFFADNKRNRNIGYAYECKKCQIIRNRKYSKAKRLKLRFQLLQQANFSCQYCGRKAPEIILEVDHKYPKSKGGLDKIENYSVACRDCNNGKGDFILKNFN